MSRRRPPADAVLVRAVWAHADARPALRRGARRPAGGWPVGLDLGRRDGLSVRRIHARGAGAGGAPGGGLLWRPTRMAQDGAGRDDARLQLGSLGRAVPGVVRRALAVRSAALSS